MKKNEYIALSACTMMLTALGIDIMLPVFGELRRHFHVAPGSSATADIVSFFFMGQIAQLIFGIFSDRFGRLPVLRIGFPLYIAGGVAAAFAPSLTLMYVARFVAGMGSSAVFSTTIAGVRDRFAGDQMARTMSLIFTIFLFTPILAPFLGSAILSVSTWQMVFLTPPLFAVLVFLWSFRLHESLRADSRVALRFKDIGNSVKEITTNRTFVRYTMVTTVLFGVFSSWIASSERVVGEIYGKPGLFPYIFAGMGLLMACGTFANSWLSIHFGARRTLKGLIILYTAAAACLTIATLLSKGHPFVHLFFGLVALICAINLSIEPNSSSLALEPLGKRAGLASALYGTCFFFIGSLVGSAVSNAMKFNVWPLAAGFLIAGIICLILVFTDKGTPQKIGPDNAEG